MQNVAYILKGKIGSVKVIFTDGWPWVRETASNRILTDGCSGDGDGFITLDEKDEVIILQKGERNHPQFNSEYPVLAEITIGRNAGKEVGISSA